LNAPKARQPPLPPGLSIRLIAVERLVAVLRGTHFEPLGEAEIADPRDRALANRLITTELRRHGHISIVLKTLLDRGMPQRSGTFEAVLRLALAQLLFLPDQGAHSALFLAGEALRRDIKAAHLSKLANAVLRRAQAETARWTSLDPLDNLPVWTGGRWRARYGERAARGFAEALLAGAPLDLTLKREDPKLIAALGATRVIADTVRLVDRDRPVTALTGFAEGDWWVQDTASAIPARLVGLPAGARVLDLCAAPGGKTAQLIKAGYRVTALDNDGERLVRLRQNLDRLGYAAELIEADATSFVPEERFEAVLLDAPCTATGTFRRHPEVLLNRHAADITERAALQRRLIAAAANCLNPGGVLIYCTCSLEPEEGEDQAQWALANVRGLAPLPIAGAELAGLESAISGDGYVRTHPAMPAPGQADGTLDGFFVARFQLR
jgi:16S rRNA (cytosine967-C5)-methyltransferase